MHFTVSRVQAAGERDGLAHRSKKKKWKHSYRSEFINFPDINSKPTRWYIRNKLQADVRRRSVTFGSDFVPVFRQNSKRKHMAVTRSQRCNSRRNTWPSLGHQNNFSTAIDGTVNLSLARCYKKTSGSHQLASERETASDQGYLHITLQAQAEPKARIYYFNLLYQKSNYNRINELHILRNNYRRVPNTTKCLFHIDNTPSCILQPSAQNGRTWNRRPNYHTEPLHYPRGYLQSSLPDDATARNYEHNHGSPSAPTITHHAFF